MTTASHLQDAQHLVDASLCRAADSVQSLCAIVENVQHAARGEIYAVGTYVLVKTARSGVRHAADGFVFTLQDVLWVALPLHRRDELVESLLAGSAMTPICSDHHTHFRRHVDLTRVNPHSMDAVQ